MRRPLTADPRSQTGYFGTVETRAGRLAQTIHYKNNYKMAASPEFFSRKISGLGRRGAFPLDRTRFGKQDRSTRLTEAPSPPWRGATAAADFSFPLITRL